MNEFKKTVFVVALLSSLLILAMTVIANATGMPSISAKSAILYEPEQGHVLYQKNAHQRLPMASTTKIMTAIIALEHLKPDEQVRIPKEATAIEGSSVYLKEGETLSVEDLLYSLMLRSANDAAVALAYAVSEDIYGFSQLMNQKATQLGLSDTSFQNPHGLDSSDHYTTAHDLAVITAYALKDPYFREICSTYKYSFTTEEGPRLVVNHNKMLKSYSGAIGVKTGYTKTSGRCLVSAAEREGKILICVTLDAPSDWSDHTALLDYGFAI